MSDFTKVIIIDILIFGFLWIFSIKKLHFKLYKFVLSRPYPFDHWLLLVTVYIKLWFYSIFYSSIFCLIFETTFIEFMKIYFVINFFLMIYTCFLFL